jgi:hypothetical protein
MAYSRRVQRDIASNGLHSMANDVFALSPISANGTLPSEGDYNAINDAFMETARGRWFLKEYARRNRNSDTAVVLEAVARIEAGIAAQRRQGPVTGLASAMAAIQTIIANAKSEAAQTITQLSDDEAFAPTHKAVRVIREVSWRLREIGYDSRICDILETQSKTITANHEAPTMSVAQDAVLAAFDQISDQIKDLADSALTVVSSNPPPAENVVSLSVRPQPQAQSEVSDIESTASLPSALNAAEETVAPAMATANVATAADVTTAEATSAVDPDIAPERAQTSAPDVPAVAALEATAAQEQAPSQEPSLGPSLGEALLARGMVGGGAGSSKTNPLAAIRRMSQAERIAFFS